VRYPKLVEHLPIPTGPFLGEGRKEPEKPRTFLRKDDDAPIAVYKNALIIAILSTKLIF
jgi:hypothetical protein